MEDLKKIQHDISELRAMLDAYIDASDNTQNLTDLFTKVKEVDESTYELLLLMYQEFDTKNKVSKKQFIKLMNKTIDIKHETIEKLMREKIIFDEVIGNNKEGLKKYFTWNNFFKIALSWAAIILFLFTLHYLDPHSFNRVMEEENNIVNSLTQFKDILW